MSKPTERSGRGEEEAEKWGSHQQPGMPGAIRAAAAAAALRQPVSVRAVHIHSRFSPLGRSLDPMTSIHPDEDEDDGEDDGDGVGGETNLSRRQESRLRGRGGSIDKITPLHDPHYNISIIASTSSNRARFAS